MTTVATQDPVLPPPEVRPRRISRKATGADRVFEVSARTVGATVLVITGGIGAFLAWQSVPTLRRYGWSFFTAATASSAISCACTRRASHVPGSSGGAKPPP